MAEYIEREKAKQYLADEYAYAAAEVIDRIPAADVVEVVHGYWKETITHNGCTWDSDCVCSVCGKSGHPCNNYCSECGAKMDGERSESA